MIKPKSPKQKSPKPKPRKASEPKAREKISLDSLHLVFEPHGGFGAKSDKGRHFPFGYISQRHPMPIFELSLVVEWDIEFLDMVATVMKAAPNLRRALIASRVYVETCAGSDADSPAAKVLRDLDAALAEAERKS